MSEARHSKDDLAKYHRKLSRGVGAAILKCMADTDTSFALMAVRLGTSEKIVRGWMDEFMDGTAQKLDMISDMCFAMGAEMDWRGAIPILTLDKTP